MNEEQHTAPVETAVHRLVSRAEDYARREPAKAAAAAFGAGFLLNVIPSRFLVGTVTALAVPLVRPALITLGLVKAVELCSGHEEHEGGRD